MITLQRYIARAQVRYNRCYAFYRHKNKRVRQHVNPFKQQYLVPLSFSATEWDQWFTNINQPLHLDIGCGPGMSICAQKYKRER